VLFEQCRHASTECRRDLPVSGIATKLDRIYEGVCVGFGCLIIPIPFGKICVDCGRAYDALYRNVELRAALEDAQEHVSAAVRTVVVIAISVAGAATAE